MPASTRFILNDRAVETAAPAGLLVLDFIRNSERLTGTKEGCKEGDCGACVILIGELDGGVVRYQPVTSCLVPLAEVHGKHVVTIEGCNLAGLNPVQEAIVEFGGTQCGFCTPGIVVSLCGLLLDNGKGLSLDDVKYALSGHLCRCTGYRSLKDCATTLERDLGSRLQANGSASRVAPLTAAGALPRYFTSIPERLRALHAARPAPASPAEDATARIEATSDAGKDSASPAASASRIVATSKPAPPGTAAAPLPATMAERPDGSPATASLSASSRAPSERGPQADPGRTSPAAAASTAPELPPPGPAAAPAPVTLVAAPNTTVPSGPLAVAETDGSFPPPPELFIAGGTDLYVQQGDTIPERSVTVLGQRGDLKEIRRRGGEFRIGALITFEEFGTHPAVIEAIPAIASFNHLIASWQIRNRATLAGNIVNASPIGDFTALLLALDARVVLDDGSAQRTVPLKQFYRGYKQIDLRPGELLTEVAFADPSGARVNFEKVSKRTCLDIASVNSACSIRGTDDTIGEAHLSLGGVAPIPLYLHQTSRALRGRALDLATAREAVRISQQEIAPISDVRGSAEYKRLLARQLLIAHFITLFPDRFTAAQFYAGDRQ